MIKKHFKKVRNVFYITILLIFTIIYISPLIITFANSFMSQREINENYGLVKTIFQADNEFVQMKIIPQSATFNQYKTILIETPVYLNAFWNSVILTVPIIVGQLIVSIFGAYALTVLEFKFKKTLLFLYIIVMLLPLQVTLLPNYIIADFLNIKENYLAIILPGIFNPLGVFLLYQNMKLIPKSYLESAQIDGCGHFGTLRKIVVPNISGGIASLGVLTYIDYWNLIDQGIIFITDRNKQPLSLFLTGMGDEQLGISFASSSFYVIPVLIVLYYCHDYLKDGISIYGLKG